MRDSRAWWIAGVVFGGCVVMAFETIRGSGEDAAPQPSEASAAEGSGGSVPETSEGQGGGAVVQDGVPAAGPRPGDDPIWDGRGPVTSLVLARRGDEDPRTCGDRAFDYRLDVGLAALEELVKCLVVVDVEGGLGSGRFVSANGMVVETGERSYIVCPADGFCRDGGYSRVWASVVDIDDDGNGPPRSHVSDRLEARVEVLWRQKILALISVDSRLRGTVWDVERLGILPDGPVLVSIAPFYYPAVFGWDERGTGVFALEMNGSLEFVEGWFLDLRLEAHYFVQYHRDRQGRAISSHYPDGSLAYRSVVQSFLTGACIEVPLENLAQDQRRLLKAYFARIPDPEKDR